MQNLNSDDLRTQLQENNYAMNILAEDNEKIVELLKRRGLQAVDLPAPSTAQEKLSVFDSVLRAIESIPVSSSSGHL